MGSWLDRLKTQPLDWLREKSCPPVLARVLTEVFDELVNYPATCRLFLFSPLA